MFEDIGYEAALEGCLGMWSSRLGGRTLEWRASRFKARDQEGG